ncbi:uncharacterized protein LOC132923061 [Rhopalosiphum padi]|uniref:uncharacterized protein LOC132923061 n=1 Tax=Rhopalosiphum padi TaxID=40932 RepID=UPI00298DF770|nr:uncharacterized protein LOC132923061 [Rhopalosiphum padi]
MISNSAKRKAADQVVGRMRDPRKVESYKSTFKKLKSKFVVNNENYMSYLVRLKKQGSVGFHQIYHTSMYKIRKNNYYPGNYIIDMDIHKEDFESELDQLKPMEEIPIENINLT